MPHPPDDATAGRAEPPLWEQLADAAASRRAAESPNAERLQKVLAAAAAAAVGCARTSSPPGG